MHTVITVQRVCTTRFFTPLSGTDEHAFPDSLIDSWWSGESASLRADSGFLSKACCEPSFLSIPRHWNQSCTSRWCRTETKTLQPCQTILGTLLWWVLCPYGQPNFCQHALAKYSLQRPTHFTSIKEDILSIWMSMGSSGFTWNGSWIHSSLGGRPGSSHSVGCWVSGGAHW